MRRDVRPPHRPAVMIPSGKHPAATRARASSAAELAQRPRPRHRAPPTARAEPRRAVLDLRPEGRAGGRERHVPVEDPAPGEPLDGRLPLLARTSPGWRGRTRARSHVPSPCARRAPRVETAQLRAISTATFQSRGARAGRSARAKAAGAVRPARAGRRARPPAGALGPAGLGGAAGQARGLGSIVDHTSRSTLCKPRSRAQRRLSSNSPPPMSCRRCWRATIMPSEPTRCRTRTPRVPTTTSSLAATVRSLHPLRSI